MSLEVMFRPETPPLTYMAANSPGGERGCPLDMSGLSVKWDCPEGSDTILDSYRKSYAAGHERDFRHFIDTFPTVSEVVDLGCGLGSAITHFLREKGKIDLVTSVDMDFRNLQSNEIPGRKVQADASNLFFLERASTDLVICMWILEDNQYSSSRCDMIGEEMYRILRPGGMLICRFDRRTGAVPLRGEGYDVIQTFWGLPFCSFGAYIKK